MKITIAAIRCGADPVATLPGGAMQRWLHSPLTCPHCEITYNLVANWDQSNDRFFDREAHLLIQMLRKAVLMDHAASHRVAHFETGGVTVRSLFAPHPGRRD